MKNLFSRRLLHVRQLRAQHCMSPLLLSHLPVPTTRDDSIESINRRNLLCADVCKRAFFRALLYLVGCRVINAVQPNS